MSGHLYLIYWTYGDLMERKYSILTGLSQHYTSDILEAPHFKMISHGIIPVNFYSFSFYSEMKYSSSSVAVKMALEDCSVHFLENL